MTFRPAHLILALLMVAPVNAASLVLTGDSITASFPGNPVAPADLYPAKLAASLGLTEYNMAVSGAQAADQSFAATVLVPSAANTHTVLIGANDARLYPPSKLSMWERFTRDLILKNALPQRVTARSAGMTLSGAWSNTLVNTVGKNTTAAGAKATAVVSGAAVYVSFIIQDNVSAGGVANVKIDGVLAGTINSASLGLVTQNGLTYAPGSVRFGGLASGSHTVEIEVTSSGKIFYLDFIAGSDQPSNPAVYVGEVLRQSYAGYGSDANVALYNAALASITDDLALDGLDVSLVELDLVPATDLADGIHPNTAGHQKIFDAFLAAIGGAPVHAFEPTQVYIRDDGRYFVGDGADKVEILTAQ